MGGDYQPGLTSFNCWKNGEIGHICWKDENKFRKGKKKETGILW